MRLSYLPFLFIIVPVLEISVFVVVGGQIGVLNTIIIILFTAILGAFFLRRQGLGLLAQISTKLSEGTVPGRELSHGVLILVAGLLLLTPGFVTDTIGFSLFIPGVRDLITGFFKRRVTPDVVNGNSFGGGFSSKPNHSGQSTKGTPPPHMSDVVVELDDDEYSDKTK